MFFEILNVIETEQRAQGVKLDQILAILRNPVPTGLVVTEAVIQPTGEHMSKVKTAAVDLQILENGTVQFTFTPVDASGNPTTLPAGTPPLTYVSSSPALTLAPSPADTSGFGLIAIGTGIAVATGVVVTGQTTLAGATAPISGSAAPVDIVAGGPVGFTVAEQ
jgi:hypothetical protein